MKYLIAVVFASLLTGCGFEIIDTGHRGVETRFGEVVSESLPEGFWWYNPFTSNITELDTRIQRWESKTNTYTKDVQQADITFVVNYSLEPAKAHIVFKEVGTDWADKLLPQAVEGVLKQIVGTWDAVDLIANRQKATQAAFHAIADGLKEKHIIVSRFEMVNIAYLKDFEKSVEHKVIAVQKAIEEQNRTKQIEETAKQKVITAEAEAKSMTIRARALEQNPKLTEWEAVQKWNGTLPQYMLGGVTPFINLK